MPPLFGEVQSSYRYTKDVSHSASSQQSLWRNREDRFFAYAHFFYSQGRLLPVEIAIISLTNPQLVWLITVNLSNERYTNDDHCKNIQLFKNVHHIPWPIERTTKWDAAPEDLGRNIQLYVGDSTVEVLQPELCPYLKNCLLVDKITEGDYNLNHDWKCSSAHEKIHSPQVCAATLAQLIVSKMRE